MKLKILKVSSNMALQMILKQHLTEVLDKDIKLATAYSYSEALNRLSHEKFFLLIGAVEAKEDLKYIKLIKNKFKNEIKIITIMPHKFENLLKEVETHTDICLIKSGGLPLLAKSVKELIKQARVDIKTNDNVSDKQDIFKTLSEITQQFAINLASLYEPKDIIQEIDTLTSRLQQIKQNLKQIIKQEQKREKDLLNKQNKFIQS